MCVQSKEKNNPFPLPVKTWKGFSMISATLSSFEERSPENVFLGSQLFTNSEQKSRDFAPLGSCEKGLSQQVTKDRMTEQKRVGVVNQGSSLQSHSYKKIHQWAQVKEVTSVMLMLPWKCSS